VAASKALQQLADQTQMTPHEAGHYESGDRRFEKIVRFATVDCVKAGWMVKDTGLWTITDEGRQAYAKYKDPEEFYKRAVELYAAWEKGRRGERAAEPSADNAPLEVDAEITLDEARESAWGEIERYLATMQPYQFQDLVGALLRGLGYHVPYTAAPGKDGGVDLIATRDALGAERPRVKVQVKRQQATVSVSELRSFMATLSDDDLGLFVSLGGFTKDAQEEARFQEKRRVTLVDLKRFFELWVEHYAKLSDEDKRRLPITPVYFLVPT
jgi:restriction system protein